MAGKDEESVAARVAAAVRAPFQCSVGGDGCPGGGAKPPASPGLGAESGGAKPSPRSCHCPTWQESLILHYCKELHPGPNHDETTYH